jgi:hypothetical protein
MADIAEVRELRKQAIGACYDEYKERIAAWRNLDTKAQGNVAIAGIFMAGAFAYISKAVCQQPAFLELLLFGLTVLLLMVSTVLAILVLQIREMPRPPLGTYVSKIAKDLSAVGRDKEFQIYARKRFDRHTEEWGDANIQLASKNNEKGRYLWRAQLFLLAAISAAALLTLIKTFRSAINSLREGLI